MGDGAKTAAVADAAGGFVDPVAVAVINFRVVALSGDDDPEVGLPAAAS
jgi:hypothetical protein